MVWIRIRNWIWIRNSKLQIRFRIQEANKLCTGINRIHNTDEITKTTIKNRIRITPCAYDDGDRLLDVPDVGKAELEQEVQADGQPGGHRHLHLLQVRLRHLPAAGVIIPSFHSGGSSPPFLSNHKIIKHHLGHLTLCNGALSPNMVY
jgi:hypothetical protein